MSASSWHRLSTTAPPFDGPAPGERVLVKRVKGSGPEHRPEVGTLLQRDTFVALVRSERTGALRVWPLLTHRLLKAPP